MSIFDSNANTGFNSFGNVNEAWGAGGGFNMNPSYASPAFMAPYRPPYEGGHIANQNPGFARSVYGVSPLNFRGAPYGVDTHRDETNYWDSIRDRPSDFGMAATQRIGVPLVAFGGAMAFAGAWQKSIPMGAQGSWLKGWNDIWGGITSKITGKPMANAATMSGFTTAGARFAGSAAEGMITGMFGAGALSSKALGGFGGFAARSAVGLAGGIGGAVTGIGAPLLAAQLGINAFDSLISDNYIGMRENSNVFRQGFRGVSFGDPRTGDPTTGAGFSRAHAARMGTDLAQFGAKDQVFNSREIASMTSMSAQMGLLDNVSGEQMTARMKSIVNQVKAVMSVAGTTEFKDAIQMMAKLQMAGVSPTNLSSTFAGLGSSAAQAGISVGRMINTVGAQGQYLFQANGLTPYVGQITAANSMAGFSSAFRSGLISSDLMARMGGVEGATQSSLTGQLNAAQTTYNMMRGFNRYQTGLGGNSVTENISNFGGAFASNPLKAIGALSLYGRSNISQMLKEEGPLATYNQARQIANQLIPGIGTKGFDQETLAATLKGMGMDDAQITAYIQELGTYQDPKTMAIRNAGRRSERIQRQKDYLSQTEQTFAMTIPGVQSVVGAWRGLSSGAASMLGGIYGESGSLIDRFAAGISSVNYGDPGRMAGATAAELEEQAANPSLNYRSQNKANQSFNRALSDHGNGIRSLQRAADAGDGVAKRALRGDSDAIQQKADEGVISKKYAGGAAAAELAQTLMSLPRDSANRLEQESKRLMGDMKSGTFGANIDMGEMLKGYNLAWDLQQRLDKNPDAFRDGSLPPELAKQVEARFGAGLGARELKQKVEQALVEATDYGIDPSVNLGSMNEGESPTAFAKRTGMRFGPATPKENRSTNAPAATKIQGLRDRIEVNRGERMQEATRNAALSMGRIDLVAAYDMAGAAKKLDTAADKQLEAASMIVSKLGGKEVTPQQRPTGASGYKEGTLMDWGYNTYKQIRGQ